MSWLPCGYKWRKVAKLFRKAKPKLTIEVQPSPKVPLRPHNSTCKVKSPPSHIIMMLPRWGTSCWFAISDGHHVSSNYAVAPVGICNDVQLKSTKNGTPVAVLSLATKSRWKNGKGEYDSRTEWHRCTAWGKLAEFAGELEKGAHVQIEGELRYREYKKDR